MTEINKLVEGFLVLENQTFRKIIPKSQFYPLMYTFYNDPTSEYIGYKKILQKLMKKYYWSGIIKNMNHYIQAYY